MAVNWQISDGDTLQSLAAWGIENAVLKRSNLGVETLTFAIPTNDIYAEPVFEWDQPLILLRDDVVWFAGRVTALPAAFSAKSERQVYVVSNNWQLLRTIIYQQQYIIPDPESSALLGSWSTRVVLGKNQYGTKVTTEAVVTQVGAYAYRVGSGVVFSVDLPDTAIAPMETVRDITCEEAVRRMIAYTPDAVGWFTYTGGVTTLVIQRRSALSAVTLDLDDKDVIEVVEGLDAMYQARPRGVVLIFITTETVDGVSKLRETRQTAGSTTGPRVVFATIALADGEAVPTGLATQYYNALATLNWTGTVRLHERDCSGLLRPGKTLNLTNGRSGWATMAAVVQATSEELITGVTTVELGTADAIGLSEFVDLMRRFRERPGAGDFWNSQDNGGSGPDDQKADTDPSEDGDLAEDPDAGGNDGGDGGDPNPKAGEPALFKTVDIDACVDGSPVTLRVVGLTV